MRSPGAKGSGSTQVRWTRGDLVCALALAALGGFYHLTYLHHGPHNLIDTGHQLSDAVRVLDGEIYGRDFMTPYGPGTPYVLAALFALLGTSLMTANLYWLAIQVVVDGGVFLLARRLAPRWVAAMAALCVIMAYGPLHKGLVNMGLVAGMVILSWMIARPGRRRAVAGALLLVLAGLFRWDVVVDGLLGILAGLALLLRRPRRETLGWFAGTVAAGMLLVALVYVALGHPLEMVRDTWARIVTVRHGPRLADPLLAWLFGAGAPADRDPWTALLFAAHYLALAGGLLWVARRLVRRCRDERTALVVGVTLTAWLVLPQLLVARKYERLSEIWSLAIVLGVWLGWNLLRRVWREGAERGVPRTGTMGWRRLAVAVALGMPLGVIVYYDATRTWSISQASFAVRSYARQVIDLPRGGTRTAPLRAERLVSTVRALQEMTAPGEPIYVTPSAPIVYFLSGRRNPTRYCDFLYYFERPEAQRQMTDAMDAAGVRIAVRHDKDILGYSMDQVAPLLAAWLEANFVPIPGMRFGRYTLMRRRE